MALLFAWHCNCPVEKLYNGNDVNKENPWHSQDRFTSSMCLTSLIVGAVLGARVRKKRKTVQRGM